MSTTNIPELWEELIGWMLASEVDRGPVRTEAEWARLKGTTDRTLRRWKSDPRFIELYDQMVASVAKIDEGIDLVSESGEATSADERDYRQVKSSLIAGAVKGNPKFLEIYFRTYGKPFVEEEVASRQADLGGLDLEDLVARALVAVGRDKLAAVLRSEGWKVEAPDA